MSDQTHVEEARGHLERLGAALAEQGVATRWEQHLVIPPSLAVLAVEGASDPVIQVRAGYDGYWLASDYRLGPLTDAKSTAAKVAHLLAGAATDIGLGPQGQR